MRHRLVVLAAVLAVSGVAGCSRAKHDRPAPQAQAPVAGAGASAGASAPAGAPSGGASAAPSGGATSQAAPTDPAGAAKGHPQTLPSGADVQATGIGPYTVGQEQAALAAARLIGPVTSGATGCDSATGVARWGSPALLFAKGKLQHLKIISAAVHTPAGIKVGSSEAGVKSAYPRGSAGPGGSWYAPTGDFALLFRLAGGRVTAVEAGPASILETGSAGC